MSGEIDLSFLGAALRRRWWIILLCVGVALALAVGIGLLQGRRYQASNTLLVQSPRYQWRFANEIVSTTNQQRDYQREVLAVARSDEIAQAASASLALGASPQDAAQQSVREAIAVRAGDGNTIVVSATADDPAQAAAYARAWTEALIASARDLYGAVQDLAAFEEQLEQVGLRLQEQESALAALRARTGLYANVNVPDEAMRSSLTLQQLNQVNAALADYLIALQALDTLQQGLAGAGPAADLAALPWELLDGPVFSQRGLLSSAIARAALDDPTRLAALLGEEASALDAAADALSAQAEQLNAALAADWQEFDALWRERNQTRDIYLILARKVSELQLQKELEPSLLSIVGSLEPTVAHVRAPLWGLLATATVAGLIVGLLLAVLAERASRKAAS
ncbi:MAG TPA: Wzz/FepE/Etk N-terminal domain-containing protein [Anaerolineae bacterium]|nr:Wzz/FepE/Etk N-terminal domain-containing protein [Anaerolineae bacterium]HNU03723.1 Wzz/FepE/Etk N-terminal domain-containing protein [Anaerolineae bacterium]